MMKDTKFFNACTTCKNRKNGKDNLICRACYNAEMQKKKGNKQNQNVYFMVENLRIWRMKQWQLKK